MLAAVYLLPEPVAIWMSARGRKCLSDTSSWRIATSCAGHNPAGPRGGRPRRRWRNVACSMPPSADHARTHSASVSRRWKVKTCRLAGSGSKALVNRVSTPVDS